MSNSSISNNIFKDNKIGWGIYFDGGLHNNAHIDNNIFSNCPGGIHGKYYGGLGDNFGDTVSGNVGIGLTNKLIELQGDSVTGLVVANNKVSDWSDHTDHTMGISVPINGPNVSGMQILNNEVSDVPGVGYSKADSHAGVRLGLEIGGPTNDAPNPMAQRTLISGNILYGTVVPISLTGGHKDAQGNPRPLVNTEFSNNVIVYYSSPGNANPKGIHFDQATESTVIYNPQPNATVQLPANFEASGFPVRVAFDNWATGNNSANIFAVGPDGTITKGGASVGTVRNNFDYPGLGPGRAIIYGMGGGDTISADTSTNPTVLSRTAFAGDVGVGSAKVGGAATLTGNAGTDTLFGGDGSDVFHLDIMTQAAYFTGKQITVGQRVTVNGGTGTGGQYAFSLPGTSGADTVTFNAEIPAPPPPAEPRWPTPPHAVFTQIDGSSADLTVYHYDWDNIRFDGKLGDDVVTINGGPQVNFPATQEFASLTLANGTSAKMLLDGNRVLVTKALVLNGTAKLDLTDNDMIIDWTDTNPYNTTKSRIASGYSGGTWSGSGITTSSGNAANYSLGYASNLDLDRSMFSGQSVDSTSVLVKFTYYGDTNLDGMVDVADLGTLASYWQTAQDWWRGDFDHTYFVDVNDLGLLTGNWQAGVGNPLRPSGDGERYDPEFTDIVTKLGLSDEELAEILAVFGTGGGEPL